MDNTQRAPVATSDCIYIPRSRQVNNLVEDVRQGLFAPPRSLPPKYFYDEQGSLLFDKICDTAEYYPTRVESAMLREHAQTLIDVARPQHILEFGSGTSRKTHHLLKACEALDVACEYLPFDVCEEMLHMVRDEMHNSYQWLSVKPLVGDYTAGLDYLHQPEGTCLYVFLGSSIGNFSRVEAHQFISEIREAMKPGDSLLLGVDRVKNHDVLHAAYNDSQGVTGEFNLNVLNVLNNELNGNFETRRFRHEAIYNAAEQRIEMYLVANETHSVTLQSLNQQIEFSEGERILTEVSNKYTREAIEDLMRQNGLRVSRHIEADDNYFSLVLAQVN